MLGNFIDDPVGLRMIARYHGSRMNTPDVTDGAKRYHAKAKAWILKHLVKTYGPGADDLKTPEAWRNK